MGFIVRMIFGNFQPSATMVTSPPETQTTAETAKKWKDWWAKNKDTAQFVKPPVKNYE
jgi:hypothetical protein